MGFMEHFFCTPKEVTSGQALTVVIRYIEARPDARRLSEGRPRSAENDLALQVSAQGQRSSPKVGCNDRGHQERLRPSHLLYSHSGRVHMASVVERREHILCAPAPWPSLGALGPRLFEGARSG